MIFSVWYLNDVIYTRRESENKWQQKLVPVGIYLFKVNDGNIRKNEKFV